MDNLDAGTYYVVASVGAAATAVSIPGAGCISPPARVVIRDVHVDPIVSFTTLPNTSCDNNFDGQITVLASTPSGPGVGMNYNLEWTVNAANSAVADAFNISSPYSTISPDAVGPGSYIVRVTNVGTNCFVDGTISMINNPQPVEVLTVTAVPQTICYPDGSIRVMTLSPASIANYDFNWFRADPNSTALVDGSNALITSGVINKINYPTMGADAYYVVGTRKAGNSPSSGCVTPPFRVNVPDLHEDPRVQFTFQPNSSCSPTNPNGILIANAAEINGANTDTYSFAWDFNGAALPGVTTEVSVSNSSQLSKAFEGNYRVVVMNVSATGCEFTTNYTLNLDQSMSLPNIITVDTTDPSNCNGNGSAEVTSISIGGGSAITGLPLDTDFVYEWYAPNLTPSNKLAPVDPLLNNIQPGSFYVLVKDILTDCKSAPTEVVILDKDIVYPVVDILQTAKQISCSGTTGSAALAATADGQNDTNLDYTFTCYPNLKLDLPTFASTSTISNLMDGNYSIEVNNTLTGCSSSAIYIVLDDATLYLPQISMTGQALSKCIVPYDGAVSARVINDFQGKLNTIEYPYPS